MSRITSNPKLVLERLAQYLGAVVVQYGEVVEIHDFGTGRGCGDLGPMRLVGRGRHWSAVGHLLQVATTLEEHGGMGCTWAGLHEALNVEFQRRHENCKVTRAADEPCPRCGEMGGDLQLPDMDATADAMMSRLSEPEHFDFMLDSIAARLQQEGAA